MIKTNYLKEKLNKNIPVIGTWIVVPSINNVDIISSSGVDFVISSKVDIDINLRAGVSGFNFLVAIIYPNLHPN